MALLSAREVWEATPYPRNLNVLQSMGIQPAKLGGMYQLLSVAVDTLFRNRIDSELLVSIKEQLDDSRMRFFEQNPALIHLIDERYFGDFCGMASHTTYSEPGFEERTLEVNCIYTTDTEFVRSKIPRVTEESEFEKIMKGINVPYSKDHLYIIVTTTDERSGAERTTYVEYLFYIPSAFIKHY